MATKDMKTDLKRELSVFEEEKEEGSDVNLAVKPCLAAADKKVTCEYILEEPPNSCIAPYSIRCSRCLTF